MLSVVQRHKWWTFNIQNLRKFFESLATLIKQVHLQSTHCYPLVTRVPHLCVYNCRCLVSHASGHFHLDIYSSGIAHTKGFESNCHLCTQFKQNHPVLSTYLKQLISESNATDGLRDTSTNYDGKCCILYNNQKLYMRQLTHLQLTTRVNWTCSSICTGSNITRAI